MKRLLLTAILVATGLLATAPLAQAEVTTCTGLLTGSVTGDVVVPTGATCTLEGAEVSGDVTVEPNGRLDGWGTITGSVSIGAGGALHLMDSLIGGDVVCRACRALTMSFMYGVGGDIRVTGMTDGYLSWDGVRAGGNIRVTGNTGEFTFIDTGAGRNFVFADNVGSAGFWYSTAAGTLRISGNRGEGSHPVFHLEGNSANNIIFAHNVGSSELLYNYAYKHLRCHGNDPPPVGLGNDAGMGLEGQCATLIGDGD